MTKQICYTQADVGCWIDGAFGTNHRRQKLIELIDGLDGGEIIAKGLEEAPEEEKDFFEDDALALLQEHTEDGFIWTMEAGDLLLVKEEEN